VCGRKHSLHTNLEFKHSLSPKTNPIWFLSMNSTATTYLPSFANETLTPFSPLQSSPVSCNGSSRAASGGHYTLSNFLSLFSVWYLSDCLGTFLFWLNFFRPRLLDFVSSLDDAVVKSASEKAFQSLPDVSKAVDELTVLKGVGPATASAVLAAFSPHLTPFMSDEVHYSVNLFTQQQFSFKLSKYQINN